MCLRFRPLLRTMINIKRIVILVVSVKSVPETKNTKTKELLKNPV